MSKQEFFLFDDLKEEINRRELQAAKQTKRTDIVLRPYQNESVNRVYDEWQTNRATLVCLPTGCGKSVVFCAIMRRWNDECEES